MQNQENILMIVAGGLFFIALICIVLCACKKTPDNSPVEGNEYFQAPSRINVEKDSYIFYDYGGGPKHQANWSQGVAFQPYTPLDQGLYTGGWRSRYQLPNDP